MDRTIDTIVKNLLRFVVRGFYGGSYVLVLDAILFHSVLAEEDLKQLLSINKTELGPLLARLRGDRLVTTHKQREYPPNSKSVERVYFYVKYPHAIDAIKWKVHQVVQRLKDDLDKNSEPNGYMCPICETKYTQLEAVQLLNYDRTEFLCSLCDEPLVEDDSGKKNKEKQDKLNRLMDQIQPVIDCLKKIDDSRIEENTFELALARLIPPQNQSSAAYTYNPKKGSTMFRPGDAAMDSDALGNSSSRRAGASSQATLHVNITTVNEEIVQHQLQERQAEERRKQNAVPEWHKESTIGQSALGRLDDDRELHETHNSEPGLDYNGAAEGTAGSYTALTGEQLEEKENERAMREYYAALAKKQADDKSEDEEEEDEAVEDEAAEDEAAEDELNAPHSAASDRDSDKIKYDPSQDTYAPSDEDEDDAAFENEFEDVMDDAPGAIVVEDAQTVLQRNGGGATDDLQEEDEDVEFEDV